MKTTTNLLFTLSLFGGLTLTAGAQSDGTIRSPEAITTAVQKELRYDAFTEADDIQLSYKDGVLTLGGTVDSLLDQERAERLAETVLGVYEVNNQLLLVPDTLRSDEQIQNHIEEALLINPATEAYEIEVSVNGGRARLTGNVESYPEYELAEKMAKRVVGVRAVDNDIAIDFVTDRPDYDIKIDIRETFSWDVLINDSSISVKVDRGVVELSGAVNSLAEKRRAERKAWVNGVRSVNADKLDVKPDLVVTTVSVVRADDAIHDAVEKALRNDPEITEESIAVIALNGRITLMGTVDRLAESKLAEEHARNTAGVLAVNNEIEVTESILTDELLAGNVERSFDRDPYFDGDSIDVEVEDDKAILTGTVASGFKSARAEQIAAETRGIQAVENRLVVSAASVTWTYSPYVGPYGYYPYSAIGLPLEPIAENSDVAILEDIKSEMFWSPFVDSDDVSIEVVDGKARLTGTVDSLAEMDAAIENAFEGGALDVENNLLVALP